MVVILTNKIFKERWDSLPIPSRELYEQSYFLPEERKVGGYKGYKMWCNRIAGAYTEGDAGFKQRIILYLLSGWFHPSTPPSANGGVPKRGFPISCYTTEVEDNKGSIFQNYMEAMWLGARGGGIGTTWDAVSEVGAKLSNGGETSGVIPFLKLEEGIAQTISQGGTRRASKAVYMEVSHPEIHEFIHLRKVTGAKERRAPDLHHGVIIPDAFMKAVKERSTWDLISRRTGDVVQTVDAFDLWTEILDARMDEGEPYIMFGDTVNENVPEEYVKADYKVKTSNLCSEITLHTDTNKDGVCCLVSLNLESYDEWGDDSQFFYDVHRFTDNILQSFIDISEGEEGFERARNSAMEERSIGIGVMGYHTLLQQNGIPVDSISARALTDIVFRNIKEKFDETNRKLADEKGASPLAKRFGIRKRNTHVTSIAPTASISTLNGIVSPGVDVRLANVFLFKTRVGSFIYRNPYLENTLERTGNNTEEIWKSILKHNGSVQHLPDDVIAPHDKEIFKTGYETDNRAIVRNTGVMQKYIDQAISCNLFIPADANKQYVYDVHMLAHESKLKTLYYVRSNALFRAEGMFGIDRMKIEEDTCKGCA